MKDWKFKVVKMSRGMQGEWFAHRAAATFGAFSDAVKYAQEFHAEQNAVLGVSDSHKYCVVPRRSNGDRMVLRSLWTPEHAAAVAADAIAAAL